MPRDSVRALIAGGGTGGHIYAGIAIAEEMQKRWENSQILFVGARRGMESKILPQCAIDFRLIDSQGIKGKRFSEMINGISRVPGSIYNTLKIISGFKPDVAVGVGGYSSGPTIVSSWILGVPSVILEQNLYPGVTNRILAGFARYVALNFSGSEKYFPRGKTFCSGNPVRKNLALRERNESLAKWNLNEELFTVLVFGGSQGARSINELMPSVCSFLRKEGEKFQIIHQTGEKDYEAVEKNYRNKGIESVVLPFIRNMSDAYGAADFIISRAGATTLSEISACGKPSMLIPFPFATNNHQEHNALFMQNEGASVMMRENEATAEKVSGEIRKIMNSREILRKMSESARRLDKPGAALDIVMCCERLIGDR